MTTKLPITGIIHTKNNEADVKAAVQSLSFCAEVIVADMASVDKTAALARQAGATVLQVPVHDFADPVRQKVINQAKYDWVFVLDSDERVPRTLVRKVEELLLANTHDAYKIPRKNFLFGSWLSHTGWWPDYQVRFFKRDHVTWPGEVHQLPKVSGSLEELPPQEDLAIEHHNYKDIAAFVERMNRYTTLEQERRGSHTPESAFGTLVENYLDRLVAQEGYKDGKAGVAAATLQAMYEGVANLKGWEKHQSQFAGSVDPAKLIESLSATQKVIAYWRAQLALQSAKGFSALWWRVRRTLKV